MWGWALAAVTTIKPIVYSVALCGLLFTGAAFYLKKAYKLKRFDKESIGKEYTRCLYDAGNDFLAVKACIRQKTIREN